MYSMTEAREMLREEIKPGDTIRTILRHVSASGMTRWISLIVLGKDKDGEPTIRDISWLAAKALGRRVNTRNHDGIETGGCGMDMGFELVYSLSLALWPEYECLVTADSTRCPGSSHVNGAGWQHATEPHRDGYALSQKWL